MEKLRPQLLKKQKPTQLIKLLLQHLMIKLSKRPHGLLLEKLISQMRITLRDGMPPLKKLPLIKKLPMLPLLKKLPLKKLPMLKKLPLLKLKLTKLNQQKQILKKQSKMLRQLPRIPLMQSLQLKPR